MSKHSHNQPASRSNCERMYSSPSSVSHHSRSLPGFFMPRCPSLSSCFNRLSVPGFDSKPIASRTSLVVRTGGPSTVRKTVNISSSETVGLRPAIRLAAPTNSGLLDNAIDIRARRKTGLGMVSGFTGKVNRRALHGMYKTATRGKARLKHNTNGPCGPAVAENPMKGKSHDRESTYDAGRFSNVGTPGGRTPEDDKHKEQLHGIVGRHPIRPSVREANDQ